jgi:mannosyltransferase
MLIEEPTGVRERARVGRIEALGGLSAATWILIAITVAGAAIRFATLTSQSYWLDESQAAHELSLSFGHMLSAWSRAEWNPPLYLIVAWPWAKVFGTGEAGVRSLSAIFGTALIPVIYLCGRELVSRRAGLIAAALTALNPFMVWYSQEAREYMLLTLLCTVSLLFFARAVRRSDPASQPRHRDLAWWAVFSALALLTQYFAGFLVLAEGLWLIWRLRSRASVAALAVQGLAVGPFIPHVLPQLRNPAQFIVSQPLELRIKQVPITFAFNTLYKSSLVTWGLVGGAVAVAIVIALLLAGATDRQLKGAGLAAGLGAFVIIVPLLMALVGHDDFLARGLMPAWPPLAIAFAAACAAPRTRVVGAALAVVLLGSFVWAGLRIDSDQVFQRPDWDGVAAALGTDTTQQRAVVAYPGQFATGPLSVLMPRVPWAGPGLSPTSGTTPGTTTELDIVANEGQTLAPDLGGARLIGHRIVAPYLVDRFALPAPIPTQAPVVQARANALLAAPTPGPAVIVQAAPQAG